MQRSVKLNTDSPNRLEQVVERARPGRIGLRMHNLYRIRALPIDEAVWKTAQEIRHECSTKGDILEEGFFSSENLSEARQIAAQLIILNYERAVFVFERSLQSRQAHQRSAGAEGIRDIVQTSSISKERNEALDILACAANKGNAEAVHEIEDNLSGYYRIREKRSSADRFLEIVQSPTLKIISTTASAVAFGSGIISLGASIMAGICGMHLIERYLLRSE